MTALNSLFEEILLETNNLKKCCHLPISFDEFEKALQTAKTFDDSDNDLIYEDRRYVCDVPETLKKIVFKQIK